MIQTDRDFMLLFSGDVIIDILSSIVLLMGLIVSLRFLRIGGKREKYLCLALGFLFLFLAFVSKLLSNIMIYSKVSVVDPMGQVTLVHRSLETADLFVFFGLLGYRILVLLWLFCFFLMYGKAMQRPQWLFISYLLLILGYLSHRAYFIFHMTAIVLVTMIGMSLLQAYRKNRSAKTKLLVWSFAVLGISYFLFLFLSVSPWFYVAAVTTQLISFFLLFIVLVLVLRHAKKTRTA